MLGISSWSSEKNIAEDFAKNRSNKFGNNGYQIIFNIRDSLKGVGIDHLSAWTGENEVIYSSKARFLIQKVNDLGNNKYEIELKEK